MSTKSIRNLLIALAALLIGFVLLVTLTEKSPGEEELGKYLALNVSEDNILYYHDSHGGFFGDGETVAVFTASDKNAALIGGSWSSELQMSRLSKFFSARAAFCKAAALPFRKTDCTISRTAAAALL